MDIEIVGNMAGYTGMTYVINSKLIDLLEFGSPTDRDTVQPAVDPYLACTWQSPTIEQFYTGYGRVDRYEYIITIAGKKNSPTGPANRIRVHIDVKAFGPAFPLNEALEVHGDFLRRCLSMTAPSFFRLSL